ncbi:MAG TPA: serine hydrolase domain-containing protein [Xanthomonadales bacterium]|nr:serine hydrolase domain-containing protein [Xanthomonadales bacterium]
MRFALAPCLLLLLSFTAHGAQVADGVDVPELEIFDDVMTNFMEAHDIPDGQLAITRQGKLVFARSYTHNSGKPTSIHSQYRIASVSKPLTSTLLHRAQQDGLLSLDDKISKHLDLTTLPGQTADPRLASVTVRQLLQHLGGFGSPGEYGFDPGAHDAAIAFATEEGLPVLKTDIQKYMNGRSLIHEPGTTFAYSNYGFMLAGMVIESVTGLPYGAYADEILNEIGIYDARQSRSQEHRLYPEEARYYSSGVKSTVLDNSGEIVALQYGGLNSENNGSYGGWTISAPEIVRWLSNLDNPLAPGSILNPSSRDEMWDLPENHVPPYNLGDEYYASGWSVREYGYNAKNTYHTGSLPGTMTWAVRLWTGVSYMLSFNKRNETGQGNWYSEIDAALGVALDQIFNWPTHDLFPIVLRDQPEDAGARYNGSWFDVTHDGEGFAISVINPNTAVIYWFTYDRQGNQKWYFGIAQLEGHRMIVDTLLETRGGRFGPGFDPTEVETTEVGSLVINFYDGVRAKADYLLNGHSGYQELSRLSVPFSSDEPEASGDDWRNGLWYDLTHDGEGYVVEVLPGGQIVIYWFTYDKDGDPAWMIGTINGESLQDGAAITMQLTEGGNFGVGFDPDNVIATNNGTAVIQLRCDGPSSSEYSGGNSRFSEVTLNLQRLATFIEPPCTE